MRKIEFVVLITIKLETLSVKNDFSFSEKDSKLKFVNSTEISWA